MTEGEQPKGLGSSIKRLLDERGEPRGETRSQTAVLGLQGRNHVVRLLNLSASGAMVAHSGAAEEGEPATLQLLDHGLVAGQVRWARDGRIGINFDRPLEQDA